MHLAARNPKATEYWLLPAVTYPVNKACLFNNFLAEVRVYASFIPNNCSTRIRHVRPSIWESLMRQEINLDRLYGFLVLPPKPSFLQLACELICQVRKQLEETCIGTLQLDLKGQDIRRGCFQGSFKRAPSGGA